MKISGLIKFQQKRFLADLMSHDGASVQHPLCSTQKGHSFSAPKVLQFKTKNSQFNKSRFLELNWRLLGAETVWNLGEKLRNSHKTLIIRTCFVWFCLFFFWKRQILWEIKDAVFYSVFSGCLQSLVSSRRLWLFEERFNYESFGNTTLKSLSIRRSRELYKIITW